MNTREFPSPGRRLLTLDTKMVCAKDGRVVELPQHRAVIDVQAVQEPKIEITGTAIYTNRVGSEVNENQ